MKKVFSVLLASIVLLSFALPAKAQVPTPGIASGIGTTFKFIGATSGHDTTKDAESDSLLTKILPYNAYNHTIQATVNRISGTSTIKAVLYSSIDGVNFVPHFASINSANASLDTFTVTNTAGVQTHIFPVDPTTHRRRFMMVFDGTGTGVYEIQSSDFYMN